MSLRRLLTRAPHSQRTATSQSWSTAYLSRPTHARVTVPHRNPRLESQKYGRQQHLFKSYSNYAPRGPPPYYGTYGQPPKSRASRLKDMAIGSGLTIILYFAYLYYKSWHMLQEMKEAEEVLNEIHEICFRYDQRMKKAEAEDDGSPESAEKMRRIFKELLISIMRAEIPKEEWDTLVIKEMGSLPRFPASHTEHGSEMVKDEDIMVFMPPSLSEKELAAIDPEERHQTVTRHMVVGINDYTANLEIDNRHSRVDGQTNSRFYEIKSRLAIMMDNLFQEGTLDPDQPTVIMFFFRDGNQSYVYHSRTLIRLRGDGTGALVPDE